MGKFEKLLHRVLSGEADANIDFADLCWLLTRLGFSERINGSHHIYKHIAVRDDLNLQPQSDSKAKKYQVRQTCDALKILLEENEEEA